jgi:hypothetical protein
MAKRNSGTLNSPMRCIDGDCPCNCNRNAVPSKAMDVLKSYSKVFDNATLVQTYAVDSSGRMKAVVSCAIKGYMGEVIGFKADSDLSAEYIYGEFQDKFEQTCVREGAIRLLGSVRKNVYDGPMREHSGFMPTGEIVDSPHGELTVLWKTIGGE